MNAVLFKSSSNFMIFTSRIWSHILFSPLFWFYFLSQKSTWVFLILQSLLLLQPFYWRNAKITQWHKYYLHNFVKKFKNTPWRLFTARKMTLSNMAFSSECDQIRRKLQVWSHLLKKSLMKKFIFCVILSPEMYSKPCQTSKMDFFKQKTLHLRCLSGFWMTLWFES